MKNLEYAGDGAAIAQDLHTFETWENSRRGDDVCEERGEEADVLTSLFLYLADGFEVGNLPSRAASLLLFFRSDLLPAQSYAGVARRIGVSADSVANAMRTLRSAIPAQTGHLGGVPVQSGIRPVVEARNQLLGGLISAKDLGAKLGMNWQEINRKARRGKFPAPVKVGRHYFYSLSQVEAFFASQ